MGNTLLRYWSTLFRRFLAALLTIGSLTVCGFSCTSAESTLAEALRESYYMYPPPPSMLDSSTENTGLLLVYFEARELQWPVPSDRAFEALTLLPVRPPGEGFTVSAFSGHLVVFQGLTPGTYRIDAVYLSQQVYDPGSQQSTTSYRRFEIPDLEVEIEAGAAVYLGALKLEYKAWDDIRRLELIDDPERESKSWQKLREEYKESPWDSRIEDRIRDAQTRAES